MTWYPGVTLKNFLLPNTAVLQKQLRYTDSEGQLINSKVSHIPPTILITLEKSLTAARMKQKLKKKVIKNH